MLAERFLPRLYDQIATSAASSTGGSCADLVALEARVSEKEPKVKDVAETAVEVKSSARPKTPAKPEVAKPVETAQVSEWISSQAIQSWARIPPEIGKLDLHPYLFVAKDRKDYFGATSILGQLATIAEKLLGPKMSVQVLEKELAQLALPEAAQVFEAVRGRIIGGDTFDTEPAGAAGLVVLVRAHPSLQGNLLDFLESLPRGRLGGWVCTGWEGVIKDTEMTQRFYQLLEAWSKDGSQFLKPTAIAVLRTSKQGSAR